MCSGILLGTDCGVCCCRSLRSREPSSTGSSSRGFTSSGAAAPGPARCSWEMKIPMLANSHAHSACEHFVDRCLLRGPAQPHEELSRSAREGSKVWPHSGRRLLHHSAWEAGDDHCLQASKEGTKRR